MATMGKYCKAYLLGRLREFGGWTEKAENARKEKKADEQEVEVPRSLTAEDIVYLQENYVVTHGIFKDENVLFDAVTPEWIQYCEQVLRFQVASENTSVCEGSGTERTE